MFSKRKNIFCHKKGDEADNVSSLIPYIFPFRLGFLYRVFQILMIQIQNFLSQSFHSLT